MEDLFNKATFNDSSNNSINGGYDASNQNESKDIDNNQEISQKVVKQSKANEWFKKYKVFIIIIISLLVALIIVSIVLYFKNNSIGSMISCKEEIIEGINRELSKAKLQISKLEIKNEELEKMNKELQKKSISEYTKEEKQSLKKKMNTKQSSEKSNEKSDKNKSDEIDTLVFNGTRTQNNQDEEDLDQLPINL